MRRFLRTQYTAYFFMQGTEAAGYALVDRHVKPVYLRQFMIERSFRRQHLGRQAVALLLRELDTDTLDIDVLCRNTAGISFWERCGFLPRSIGMRLSGKKSDG